MVITVTVVAFSGLAVVRQQQWEDASQMRETNVVMNKKPAQIEPPPWFRVIENAKVKSLSPNQAAATAVHPKIPPTIISIKANELGVTDAAQ